MRAKQNRRKYGSAKNWWESKTPEEQSRIVFFTNHNYDYQRPDQKEAIDVVFNGGRINKWTAHHNKFRDEEKKKHPYMYSK